MYIDGSGEKYIPYLIIGPSNKNYPPPTKNPFKMNAEEFLEESMVNKFIVKNNKNVSNNDKTEEIKLLSKKKYTSLFDNYKIVENLIIENFLNKRVLIRANNNIINYCTIDYHQLRFPHDITDINNKGIYVLFNLFVYKNEIYNPFERVKILHGIHMTKKKDKNNNPIQLDSFQKYITTLIEKYQ